MVALAVAVCATIIAAAAHQPMLHMAAAGIVSIAIAVMAIRDHQQLVASGAPTNAIGSSTARYLGLVWSWGALALLVTYLLILENEWREWWQFFLGFAFAAVASLVFSNMLDRDRAAGRVDPTLAKVGRVLIQAQLAGMVLGVISLFVDGKFPRDARYPDWAGCDIFFFGALAIAAISLDALRAPARV
jgi:FtsH-binding integral membrane protein